MQYPTEAINKIYSNSNARQLIGCLLNNPQILLNEKYKLNNEDFINLFHQYLYRSIRYLAKRGAKEIDCIDIYNTVKNRNEVYQILKDNDYESFIDTFKELSNQNNIDVYYDKVRKMSLLREYCKSGFNVDKFYDLDNDEDKSDDFEIEDIVNYYEGLGLKIKKEFDKDDTIEEYIAGVGFEAIKEKYKENPVFGFSTMSDYLNTATRGYLLGQFTVLSMKSGSGKSTYALANLVKTCSPEIFDEKLNMYVKNPCYQHIAGYYLEYEMSYEEVTSKLIATISKVPCDKIMDGKYTEDENERIDYAIDILKKSNIYITIMPNLTVDLIEDYIKEYVITKNVKFVVFDYISPMASLSSNIAKKLGTNTREDMVLAEISTRLKEIARKYNVAILSFTQTNANAEKQEVLNAMCIAGGMSVQNKLDVGSIVYPPRKSEETVINAMKESGKISKNLNINRIFHLYKMRFSSIPSGTKIFVKFDLSTGEIKDGFCTDVNNNPINIKKTKLECINKE